VAASLGLPLMPPRAAASPRPRPPAGDTATLAGSPPYYTLLGRTSVDIIKRGGYKVSALHVESALLEHPALAEAAVLGLPDELHGERIVAMVALRGQRQGGQQGEPGDEELRRFCGERLPPYQVPQLFLRVSSIPRNAMGKVNKKALAQEVAARLGGQQG
jgi:malonyl-CoA/methylmalonyl-CoA synthetase